MPPRKKARKEKGGSVGPKTRSGSSMNLEVTLPGRAAQAPEPEYIQLANDQDQAQAGKETAGMSGESFLSNWTKVLGVPQVSNEMIRQNTHQSEFQMPDVRCADDDLAMHVPEDICMKIWKQEYINLAALLKKNQKRRGDESGNLYINEHGQIQTRPKILKEITNIREWTDAFLIFMTIYLKKHKNQVFELIQYMSTIREAESRCQSQNLAWREYDAEFRTRQALKSEPWNKIYSDLWLKLMTNSGKTEFQASQTRIGTLGQPNQPRPSRGICFDFNKGRCYFKNCKFSHICLACKGDHAEKQCPRNPNLQNIPENTHTSGQPTQTNMTPELQKPFRGPFRRR